MELGKKLYQSSAMPAIKSMAILISITLFLNLYFQTYSDPTFLKENTSGFKAIVNFHTMYPAEFLLYFFAVLVPAIYYGFIRGVRFFEHGMVINRGLPFFNMVVDYATIEKYEMINQKHFLAITRKDTEDEYMFSVNKIDRALAILDQHHIKGLLGKEAKTDQGAHKKLFIIFIFVGIVMALIQYSGFIRQFFR